MFGSRLGLSDRRIEWRYLWFDKIQDGGWRPSWIYKNGHNFATALPIDVMFGSSMRFSGSADLMVQLSVTLSDPEPQFRGHSIVQRRISLKRCVRSTPCLVLGKGFRGRRIEWRYFPFDNIQDGGWRPSWNSHHLGMTALSRVTLAPAGLSCFCCCFYQICDLLRLLHFITDRRETSRTRSWQHYPQSHRGGFSSCLN